MSTFTWTATGGGDWSTPTDWDIGTAPNDATAVAIIPGAPGAYTVTIGASDNQTINAITLGDFAGGHVGPTLEIAGSLTFAGNGPTLGFQSGLLQIDAGGVLAGQGLLGSGPQGSGVSVVNDGTVLANAGANTALAVVAPFTNNGTVLAGNGSVEIEGSTLTNLSGTTLTGGTWIAQGPTAGAFNQIELGFNFDAVIAVDAANIVLDGRASEILGYAGALHTGGNFQPIEQQLSSIAATGTLQLLNGRGYVTGNALDDAGSLILQGGTLATGGLTIDTNGTLAGFGVVTGSVANQGAILASGGVLDLTTPVSGIGVLGVTPGSTLILNGATAGEINNQGTIYAASGLLVDDGQLAGSGTLVVQNGATIEFFTGTSQNVAFSGSDATLRLDNFAGYHGALVGFAQGDSLVLAGNVGDQRLRVRFVAGGDEQCQHDRHGRARRQLCARRQLQRRQRRRQRDRQQHQRRALAAGFRLHHPAGERHSGTHEPTGHRYRCRSECGDTGLGAIPNRLHDIAHSAQHPARFAGSRVGKWRTHRGHRHSHDARWPSAGYPVEPDRADHGRSRARARVRHHGERAGGQSWQYLRQPCPDPDAQRHGSRR